MDHSSYLVAARAPAIPQQATEPYAMDWAQLTGGGVDPGADRVAPFDMEAAPMGPGINVGQAQTPDSLARNVSFTPAQAALQPQLADLGNDSAINDHFDFLLGTAAYSGTAQEHGALQDPSYGPLSPAQTQTSGWSSPVSDSDDLERRIISRSFSPSPSYLCALYGDLPSERGDEDIAFPGPAFSDN
jgi:hypothetical protein